MAKKDYIDKIRELEKSLSAKEYAYDDMCKKWTGLCRTHKQLKDKIELYEHDNFIVSLKKRDIGFTVKVSIQHKKELVYNVSTNKEKISAIYYSENSLVDKAEITLTTDDYCVQGYYIDDNFILDSIKGNLKNMDSFINYLKSIGNEKTPKTLACAFYEYILHDRIQKGCYTAYIEEK